MLCRTSPSFSEPLFRIFLVLYIPTVEKRLYFGRPFLFQNTLRHILKILRNLKSLEFCLFLLFFCFLLAFIHLFFHLDSSFFSLLVFPFHFYNFKMSLGWLTESGLLPKESKKIKVESNSLVGLKAKILEHKSKLEVKVLF